MGLSEQDVQKQIKHMIAFIDQEADEKAEEIEVKAEEEFNIEKSKIVNQQRIKIEEYYKKKLKQIDLQKKIQNSNLANQSRLKTLRCQEEILRNLLDQTRARLIDTSRDPSRYRSILQGLITQGLCQLLEPDVFLYCRQQDVQLVQEVLDAAVKDYEKISKKKCSAALDQSRFLPADSAGGVELQKRDSAMRVNCSLESRLESIFQQAEPEIRKLLFGVNPNRKFDK
jgi:V-type H+-transporting ATPase subunit E